MDPRNTFCGRTRREFLWQAGGGFTSLGLVDMLSRDGFFTKEQPGDDPAAIGKDVLRLVEKARPNANMFGYDEEV